MQKQNLKQKSPVKGKWTSKHYNIPNRRTPSKAQPEHKSKRRGLMTKKEREEHCRQIDTTVYFRENPIRDVIHFESPPRRRLREQETKVIETFYQCKFLI